MRSQCGATVLYCLKCFWAAWLACSCATPPQSLGSLSSLQAVQGELGLNEMPSMGKPCREHSCGNIPGGRCGSRCKAPHQAALPPWRRTKMLTKMMTWTLTWRRHCDAPRRTYRHRAGLPRPDGDRHASAYKACVPGGMQSRVVLGALRNV